MKTAGFSHFLQKAAADPSRALAPHNRWGGALGHPRLLLWQGVPMEAWADPVKGREGLPWVKPLVWKGLVDGSVGWVTTGLAKGLVQVGTARERGREGHPP